MDHRCVLPPCLNADTLSCPTTAPYVHRLVVDVFCPCRSCHHRVAHNLELAHRSSPLLHGFLPVSSTGRCSHRPLLPVRWHSGRVSTNTAGMPYVSNSVLLIVSNRTCSLEMYILRETTTWTARTSGTTAHDPSPDHMGNRRSPLVRVPCPTVGFRPTGVLENALRIVRPMSTRN